MILNCTWNFKKSHGGYCVRRCFVQLIGRLRIAFTAKGKREIRVYACFLEVKSTKMRIVQTNSGL